MYLWVQEAGENRIVAWFSFGRPGCVVYHVCNENVYLGVRSSL
jgi:hypothetical protein